MNQNPAAAAAASQSDFLMRPPSGSWETKVLMPRDFHFWKLDMGWEKTPMRKLGPVAGIEASFCSKSARFVVAFCSILQQGVGNALTRLSIVKRRRGSHRDTETQREEVSRAVLTSARPTFSVPSCLCGASL